MNKVFKILIYILAGLAIYYNLRHFSFLSRMSTNINSGHHSSK